MPDALSPAQELVALRAGAVTAAAELTAANELLAEAQGQVTALTARAETAEANATRLTGELGTANASLSTANGNLTAMTGERDSLATAINNGGHFAFSADRKALTLTATGTNHFIAAHLAAGGHVPLKIGGEVDKAPGATGAKPAAEMTLHEKAAAATNAQPQIAAYTEAYNLRKN